MYPPTVLCLNDNRAATLDFLAKLRKTLSIPLKDGSPVKRTWMKSKKGPKGEDIIKRYYDFSVVERCGTSAAVILASEYDRTRRVMGRPPPAINLDRWGEGAFHSLFQLGFFEVVGLVDEVADRKIGAVVGDTLINPMISNQNGNGLPEVSEAIRELTAFINSSCPVPASILSSLYTSLGEAMCNVSRHAYEPPFESKVGYVPRWWFTAEANRVTRKITAVLFDQGATIPVTLPYKEQGWLERLRSWRISSASKDDLPAAKLDLLSDSAAIKYAMREGTTQTDEAGRGKGLPQMKKLIDKYRPGKLTIMSRAGVFSYATDGGVYSSTLQTPLGGTLIEWEIEVPK